MIFAFLFVAACFFQVLLPATCVLAKTPQHRHDLELHCLVGFPKQQKLITDDAGDRTNHVRTKIACRKNLKQVCGVYFRTIKKKT